MLFWAISIGLVGVAVISVLVPLARTPEDTQAEVSSSDIYKSQLEQVEADIAENGDPSGVLAAQRAEVARRLLREERSGKRAQSSRSASNMSVRLASIFALAVIPVVSFGTYIAVGKPGQGDFPISARAALPLNERPIGDLVKIAEQHLAKNPEDARGWQVIADVYRRLNQPAKRARALEQVVRINGESPPLKVEIAEALTIAGGNIVPARARIMFESALGEDPSLTKAAVYLALSLEQEGKIPQALARWQAIAGQKPASPEFTPFAQQRIAMILSRGADQKNTAAAESDAGDGSTQEMIANMVNGLAQRLAEDGGSVEEWTRLVRSYMVLERGHEAALALKAAQDEHRSDDAAVAQLEKLRNQFKVPLLATTEGSNN